MKSATEFRLIFISEVQICIQSS